MLQAVALCSYNGIALKVSVFFMRQKSLSVSHLLASFCLVFLSCIMLFFSVSSYNILFFLFFFLSVVKTNT